MKQHPNAHDIYSTWIMRLRLGTATYEHRNEFIATFSDLRQIALKLTLAETTEEKDALIEELNKRFYPPK